MEISFTDRKNKSKGHMTPVATYVPPWITNIKFFRISPKSKTFFKSSLTATGVSFVKNKTYDATTKRIVLMRKTPLNPNPVMRTLPKNGAAMLTMLGTATKTPNFLPEFSFCSVIPRKKNMIR